VQTEGFGRPWDARLGVDWLGAKAALVVATVD
jgi:hypothetical protein